MYTLQQIINKDMSTTDLRNLKRCLGRFLLESMKRCGFVPDVYSTLILEHIKDFEFNITNVESLDSLYLESEIDYREIFSNIQGREFWMGEEDGSRSLYLLGEGLNVILLNLLACLNGFSKEYIYDKYELYELLKKNFLNRDDIEVLEEKKEATCNFFDSLIDKINEQRNLKGILDDVKMIEEITKVMYKQNSSTEGDLVRLFFQIAVSGLVGGSKRTLNGFDLLLGVRNRIDNIRYNIAKFGVEVYRLEGYYNYNFEISIIYNDPRDEEKLYPFKIKFESEKHIRGDFVPVVEIKKEAKCGYASPSIKFIISYFALDLLKLAIDFARFYLTNVIFRKWVDQEIEKIKEIDRDEFKDFLEI